MKQEFLNEAKLPFKDCTREQQHILLDAVLDGNHESLYDGNWQSSDLDLPRFMGVYRTKPIKRLAIPWEHIKPEYRWAAMDEDGSIYLYSDKPDASRSNPFYWKIDQHANAFSFRNTILNIDTSGIDWRDSLVERPADK